MTVVQMIFALLAAVGGGTLLYLLGSWLFTPTTNSERLPVVTVVQAIGNGEALEQTVKALRWRRREPQVQPAVILLDLGLTPTGHCIAARLETAYDGVQLCDWSQFLSYMKTQ